MKAKDVNYVIGELPGQEAECEWCAWPLEIGDRAILTAAGHVYCCLGCLARAEADAGRLPALALGGAP